VQQHAELGWILLCNTYMGELSRMTQFKDKSAKAKNVGVGIFTYPSLMAADILLYQTNLVPVGQDQKQHLELARDLAIRMNNTYGELFKVPEVFIPPVGAKIMSLQDPLKKMSKSDEDPTATVFLSDTDDVIMKKIKRAVTDSGSEIVFAPEREDKAGVTNLLTIQAAITGLAPAAIAASYAGKQYGHLKVGTAEVVVEHLRPLREEYQRLLQDRGELDRIFAKGADAARERAETTMKKVRQAIGFLPRR
jgi:tryptophanyl-tRNA synthetase